jgi:phosphoglycolate phosphatase-like HAD superfamily hydrolase
MPLRALLFDLDGTLVDTNEAHARAYARALAAHGHDVPAERVLRLIGKGGEFLLPDLLGEEAAGRERGAISEAKKVNFARLAVEEGFRLFDGAEAVLDAARAWGLRLALCTAADGDELDVIFDGAGKDLRPCFDVVTTASDADDPKPEPDVLHVALRKLGLGPADAALVGDTIYDGQTAGRAGVPFLGVATGVWTEADLRDAGARAVYAGPAALLARLGEALAAAGAR